MCVRLFFLSLICECVCVCVYVCIRECCFQCVGASKHPCVRAFVLACMRDLLCS